jgi:Flp pilus assembly pilin Flp
MWRHLLFVSRDEKAQSLVEYALIVSFVGAALVASVAAFGTSVSDLLSPIIHVTCSPQIEQSQKITGCPLSVLFSRTQSELNN